MISVHNKTTKSIKLPSIQLPSIMLIHGDKRVEENSNPLRSEIDDGFELKAVRVPITVMVQTAKSCAIHILPVSYLR